MLLVVFGSEFSDIVRRLYSVMEGCSIGAKIIATAAKLSNFQGRQRLGPRNSEKRVFATLTAKMEDLLVARLVLADRHESAMLDIMSINSRSDIRPMGRAITGDTNGTSIISDTANTLLGLPMAAVISLLPQGLRHRWRALPLTTGTFISSALQIALVSWWLIVQYTTYAEAAADSYTILVGSAHYLGFLIATPLGMFALYMAFEGLIRLASSTAMGEPLGTLPLWILERTLRVLGALFGAGSSRICRDVAIVRLDDMLEIRTCQPRDWDAVTTVEYRGVYYRVIDTLHTDDEKRPYLYRLEPASDSHLIRQIHRYSPDELL